MALERLDISINLEGPEASSCTMEHDIFRNMEYVRGIQRVRVKVYVWPGGNKIELAEQIQESMQRPLGEP